MASRDQENNLTQFSWRYRSPTKSQDGRNLFELNFGYGIGSAGNGVIVSGTTTIIPGLRLRASYEDISLTANTGNFRLDISSRIEFDS